MLVLTRDIRASSSVADERGPGPHDFRRSKGPCLGERTALERAS
jgi:hypothetical protein